MSVEQLLDWKNQGLTVKQIAAYLGISEDAVRGRYKYAKIKPADGIKRWDYSRFLNESDEDAQYVIGLLAADGYLDRKAVKIWISEKDIELLHRILQVFNRPDGVIYRKVTSVGSEQAGICIGSLGFMTFLADGYGFTHQKSFTIPFPRHLSNPLPYLRGFFDGDGHMGQTCTFTSASEDFKDGLLDWIGDTYGFAPNVQLVGPRKNVYNINFRKKHEEFIRDLFSCRGLARKTEAFERYLPKQRDRSRG